MIIRPHGLSVAQSRRFLFWDEWLGIALAHYMWLVHTDWSPETLAIIDITGLVVGVYIVGYLTQMYREHLAEKERMGPCVHGGRTELCHSGCNHVHYEGENNE